MVAELVRNRDFYGMGIFLVLVFLIGYQEMVSPAIGVMLLLFAAEALFKRSLVFRFNTGLFLFIGLFLMYLLGLLWSEHRDIGWKLLEYKMSFFIFPIVFLFPKRDADYWLYLRGIIWGCLVLIIRLLYEKYTSSVDVSFYEISRQNLVLHPTYVTIYFSSAIIFLWFDLKKKGWNLHWSIILLLSVLFAYFIFVIGSFAGILFLGILIAAGIGFMILHFTNRYVLLVYVVIAPLLVYMALTQVRWLQYDFEVLGQVKTEISEGKVSFLEKNKAAVSGTRERVMLWYISSEIIADKPFGVGTGDIDFHLAEKCEKYDLQILKEQNLNPHNQFLQIGIDLGWPGIVYLIALMSWFFIKGIRRRSFILILLIASLTFNSLFESVLQKQSGIVFYTFVICLVLLANEMQLNQRMPADARLLPKDS